MKRIDDQLDRLFKSAARAAKPAPKEASFALETRVMGQWRSSLRAENGDFLVVWFRRATIGACLLAAASLAWNYHDLTSGTKGIGDELAIADSSMKTGLNP